jgi:hypothetical protein
MKIAYTIIIFLLTMFIGLLTFKSLGDLSLPLTILFCVLLLILTYLVVDNSNGKEEE